MKKKEFFFFGWVNSLDCTRKDAQRSESLPKCSVDDCEEHEVEVRGGVSSEKIQECEKGSEKGRAKKEV